MDALHLKNMHFTYEFRTFRDSHTWDRSAIKRLTNDMKETLKGAFVGI